MSCFCSIRRNLARTLIAVAILRAWLPVVSYGAEKYGNALDWVPADSAFFSDGLRMREQVEIVGNSKAWEKFKAIPVVAQAWQATEAQLKNPQLGIALQFMKMPENQQLLQMFADMFSNEVVFFGSAKAIDTIELFQIIQTSQRIGQIQAAAGNVEAGSTNRFRAVLEALEENSELLHAPEFSFGFKLIDVPAAKTQLQRLEVLAGIALGATPLKDCLKREKIGDTEFLTFSLDGSMLPWSQVPFDQYEEEEGEFDELKQKLSAMTLVISLGVFNDYLLLSVQESTAALEKLAKGPALGGVKQFSPLEKFRDRKLVGLGYVSQDCAERLQMTGEDIDALTEQVDDWLELAGVEDDAIKERAAADAKKLGDDLKPYIAEPGASMSFGFLTDAGYESYAYNWTKQRLLDSSKPLGLAQHLGGDPIFAVVSRTKYDPASYDLVSKWLEVAFGYVEDFGVPRMEAAEQQNFADAMEIAKPLFARADKATRELLIPSLKDGQSAFVLDAKISSKQWQKEMPAAEQSLPMAELAIVIGVSDPKLLKQAITEYKAIADELVAKVREKNPEKVPADFKLPTPEAEKTSGGMVYKYVLPTEAGLDAQIAPSGGVGEKVAVLSTSPQLTARTLASTTPKGAGLVTNAGKPCATVVYFNWASLVTAAAPWVEYAIRENAAHADEDEIEMEKARAEAILGQVMAGLELLKCWQTTESVTTIEDDVLVTHSKTTFRDVE